MGEVPGGGWWQERSPWSLLHLLLHAHAGAVPRSRRIRPVAMVQRPSLRGAYLTATLGGNGSRLDPRRDLGGAEPRRRTQGRDDDNGQSEQQ